MANFDSLVIDRVLEIIGENSDGDIIYLLNNLSNVSINTTSESKDKTDALGVLIKRFYTSKSVEVSADCNLLSLSMLSQTFGTDKVIATEDSKFKAPKVLHIDTIGIKEYVIPESQRPEALTKLYALESNGCLGKAYTLADGAAADTDKFVYDKASGKITLPTGVTGTLIAKYDYETSKGVKVVNEADKFPKTSSLTMKVLVSDTCSVDVVRAAYIVFPSFQVSPDCDLTLETDSTVSFSGVAQRDYCQAGAPLYYIVMTEDDIEEE
nr:MAG TPA: putative structural protein [Caudoviricetes sp.]